MSDDDRKGGDAPGSTSEAIAAQHSGANPSADKIAGGGAGVTEACEIAGDGSASLILPPNIAAPLQPGWLRPSIVALVTAAHLGALAGLSYVRRQPPPAVETIEATVIAVGDESPVNSPAAPAPEPGAAAREAKPDQSAQQSDGPEPSPPTNTQPPAAEQTQSPLPEPKPSEPTVAAPEETPPLSPPQESSPVGAAEKPAPAPARSLARLEEPSKAVEQTFETLPPPPPPRRVETPPPPKPNPARSKPPKPAVRRESAPRETTAKESKARSVAASNTLGSSEAHRVGSATGKPVDSGASRASYAALVIAEIQAHRYYPASARERSEEGAVGVTFTIGPSGRVASASIVRPSGFAALDDAARRIVLSIGPPPPPGGTFSASTTIRFHVE